jgi:hypothetical protein
MKTGAAAVATCQQWQRQQQQLAAAAAPIPPQQQQHLLAQAGACLLAWCSSRNINSSTTSSNNCIGIKAAAEVVPWSCSSSRCRLQASWARCGTHGYLMVLLLAAMVAAACSSLARCLVGGSRLATGAVLQQQQALVRVLTQLAAAMLHCLAEPCPVGVPCWVLLLLGMVEGQQPAQMASLADYCSSNSSRL